MRSIWSGSLSFGLINIPVKLYSGINRTPVELDMLHKKDMSPIRYARICKLEEKEVPYKEIVKGYEYEEGEYVEISEDDFKEISAEKSETIDIQLFTDEDKIDTVYYDKPYFLEPAKGGKKPYILLKEALKKSGKVAVAKYVMRNHVHIGVIKVFEDALILNQMRYSSELRATKELDLPAKEKVAPKEIDLAIKLIDQLTEPFKPNDYIDNYAEELKELIDWKLKGKKKTKKKVKKPEPAKATDLLSKLKESLSKRSSGHSRPAKRA